MIELRTVEEEDRTRLRRWRNLPEVAQYMYTEHKISEAEHNQWFDRINEDASRWSRIIVLDEDPVGFVSISDIDREAGRCSWAFYLASDKVRGRGVGSWVEFQVIDTVFSNMGLNKLCCEVLTMNRGVIAMHESFGFRREGYFREHVQKRDQTHDVIALAMLSSEWVTLRPAIVRRLAAKGVLEGDA